jgi:hypothetical protein
VAWEGETKAGWLTYSIETRKYKIYMRIYGDNVRRNRNAVYITAPAVLSVKRRGFRPAIT